MATEELTPFLASGESWDEVIFEFDDGQKLYVSQNFLSLASPVFKAMFESDFEEKKTKTVKLVGKEFDDMLELLHCLHPNIQKPITFENVLTVSSIAEEYQCRLLIKRCKETMSAYLKSEVQRAIDTDSHHRKYECALACLKLLIEADKLNYCKQLDETVIGITRLNFKYFTGMFTQSQKKKPEAVLKPAAPMFGYMQQMPPSIVVPIPSFSVRSTEDMAKDCNTLYKSISEKLKCCLLTNRLNKSDEFDDIL